MDLIIFLIAFVLILTYLVHPELYFRQLKQEVPVAGIKLIGQGFCRLTPQPQLVGMRRSSRQT
jgi:hypothetical protein